MAGFFADPLEEFARAARGLRRRLPDALASEASGRPTAASSDSAAFLRITISRPTQQTAASRPGEVRRAADAWRRFAARHAEVELIESSRRWSGMGGEVALPSELIWRTPDDVFATLASEPGIAAASRLPKDACAWSAAIARFEALVDRFMCGGAGTGELARALVRTDAAFLPAEGSNGGLDDLDFERLLRVLDWCRSHRPAGIRLRALPVAGVDTKWVERHLSVVAVLDDVLRLGSLDAALELRACDWPRRAGFIVYDPVPSLLCRNLSPWLPARASGLAGEALPLPVALLAAVEPESPFVVMVENIQTGLTLAVPPSVPVLMGLGRSAAAAVQKLPWLRAKQILYAGDLDAHGLTILGELRRAHGNVTSILMSAEVFHRFEALAVDAPADVPAGELVLEPDEADLLDLLTKRQGRSARIEQERLPIEICQEALDQALGQAHC